MLLGKYDGFERFGSCDKLNQKDLKTGSAKKSKSSDPAFVSQFQNTRSVFHGQVKVPRCLRSNYNGQFVEEYDEHWL